MPQHDPSADILLTGGHVLTLDPASSRAEAIAIRGNRIVAVGSAAEAAASAGPSTRVIDLAGRTVIPGIIDSHAHMEREGLKAARPSLAGARCIDDVLRIVAREAAVRPSGDWVITMPVGETPHYFDERDTLAERRMPTRWELDSVAPDHPVCIMAAFGNWGAPPCYWALNSAALALNGITGATQSAFGEVEIVKDPASGEPTGVIVERGQRPVAPLDVLRAVPPFTYAERLSGLRDSMRIYNAVGTTAVYEGHGSAPETIALYRDLWERGEMTVRSRLTVSPTWRDLEAAGPAMRDTLAWARGQGLGDAWLTVSGVFIGLLGDRMLRDRSLDALPDTGWAGFIEPATSLDEFRALAFLAAENDLRLHTIVSGRMEEALDVLEAVNRDYPIAPHRWMVEHIDVVTPDHVARLKRLGAMVTSIPASTIWKKGKAMLDRPGSGNDVAPLRSLLEAGVPMATGTDNIPYNPFFTLWTMVARHERTTGRVIGEDQRLTVEQGLRTLTVEGAKLSFDEQERGMLEVGKLADLAVLSDNPLEVPVDALKDVRAVLTLVDGRIVHDDGV